MPKNDKGKIQPLMDASWKSEWNGMPEFVQEANEPFQAIIMRFRSQEDIDAFSKLIDQSITPQTKSLWYPVLIQKSRKTKRYVDES